MKLLSSVLFAATAADKIDYGEATQVWYRSDEFKNGNEITLNCNNIADNYGSVSDIKWYRKAVYRESKETTPEETQHQPEEKFIEYQRSETTGELEQTVGADGPAELSTENGELHVVYPADTESVFGPEPDPTGLSLAYLCEADIASPDDSKLDEHPEALYMIRFLSVPENPIETIDDYGIREFAPGSSETMADCISGYSSQDIKAAWYAVNQNGERTLLPDGNQFIDSSKLEDRQEGHDENVQVTLQFPFQNGNMVLDKSYDRNHFECEVTYWDAVNEERVNKKATNRFPETGEIRVEHKMDSIDFTVNNVLASGDSEVIVKLGEPVELACQPNGFKIGEQHVVDVTRNGDILDKKATFDEKAEVTCTAELDGAKETKTVTVKPISIGKIEKAEKRRIRPNDPYDIFITLDGEGNVDLTDDLIVTFYNSLHTKEEAKLVSKDELTARYETTSSKIAYVIIQYKDSDIEEKADVTGDNAARKAGDTDNFCEFEPLGNLGSSVIKMWYKYSDDEGQFTLYDNFETSTKGDIVKGELPDENLEKGVYICCYDHRNDLNDVFAGMTGDETSSLFDEDEARKLFNSKFDSKLSTCVGYYDNVVQAGFPWWIILVLLLIIIVVIGACWFWQKKKDQNENDPDVEAGNVEKPSAIPDGELEATQEEQQDLLENQQQEGTK